MSVRAILACFSVYSALYCLYFVFAQSGHGFLILVAIGLLIFAAKISPYAYESHARDFQNTLMWGNFWVWPLITWWRLFILPAKLFLRYFYD